MTTLPDTRLEHDLLGERPLPAEAYWGIHTLRAKENFGLLGQPVNPALVCAFAQVKAACVRANRELGYLDSSIANAILHACEDVREGCIPMDQFSVDALQGGAGTSTNMNVNEVLANRALEILGESKGCYNRIHPIEHVNLHQSTNDVYPTALKIAAIEQLQVLSDAMARLQGACQEKETAWQDIIKIGRTEWQDAVPMTLGQEFSAFAEAFARDRWRTFKCQERLRIVNLGGTAIGTGLTAPRRYIFRVIEELRVVTGLGLSRGENVIDATANSDPFVEASGILKACAVNFSKVAGDLRLLQRFGEIRVPAKQAGSSIMPGKVNPVIPEALIQGAMKVSANDMLVAESAARATLQINEFLPLLAHALLESLDLLTRMAGMLTAYIQELEADAEACLRNLENSPTLVTALLPVIGYERAEALLQSFESDRKGESLRTYLENMLGTDVVSEALAPQRILALGYPDHA